MGFLAMSAIERCERETIEICTYGNPVKKPGWRWQDFAVHAALAQPGQWAVCHLPSGCAIARGFPSAEIACEAMLEIALLRNDWNIIWKDDVKQELFDRVEAIAKKYSASVGRDKPEGKWQRRFNNYSATMAD
jgi:hypothetical protein